MADADEYDEPAPAGGQRRRRARSIDCRRLPTIKEKMRDLALRFSTQRDGKTQLVAGKTHG